jgi:hypothetical protein
VGKSLYDYLDRVGLLNYGTVIHVEVIRDYLGLVLPKVGTLEDFNAVMLRELSEIDIVRNKLLSRGMYLAKVKSNYRILLPSENAEQVASYMRSADKKLKRGLRLHSNTPIEYTRSDDTTARIHLKRESIRDQVKHSKTIKK